MARVRPSLYSVVAVCLLGIGVLGLALVLFSARIHRQAAHENRAEAVREQVRLQAAALVDALGTGQRTFALELMREPRFRRAWRERDRAAIGRSLASVVARATGPLGDGLRAVRLTGPDGAVIAAAGPAPRAPACGARPARDTGAPDGGGTTCVVGDRAVHSTRVALAGLAPPGAVELVADPVAVLRRIGNGSGMALRIERPGGGVLYEAPGWPAMVDNDDAVVARYLARGHAGEPVVALRAASPVGLLDRQLADSRDFVLLAACAVMAAALLLALVSLRRMMMPLRALQQAAERVSRDGAPSGFRPVPEAGPEEIATPIRSFNRMVRRLRALVSELEGEVSQRRAAEDGAHRARELAEEHARRATEAREFSHGTLEAVVDAVIATDVDGRVEYMNPAAEELTGTAEADASGRPIESVVVLRDRDTGQLRDDLVGACLCGEEAGEHRVAELQHPEGRRLFVDYAVVAMYAGNGEIAGAVLIFHDVTAAQRMTERLTYQATHDALTGLINRYEFERRLRSVADTAHAGGAAGALCYLDLDEFKLVNDTCGHGAGDELLRQLAVLLTDRLAGRGTLGRLGGDEFGLLLHPCSIPAARAVADELREAVQGFRFVWAERMFTIGVSAGLVAIDRDSGSTDELLSAADTACYLAKDSGSNRLQVYQADDEALLARQAEMHWVSELNHALEADRFVLYYQDIVPAVPNEATPHYEVLLRMIDARGTLRAPGSFLSAAERYNLAPAIDYWVIDHASDWLARNELAPDAVYSLNLSGRSLAEGGFLERVLALLDANAAPAANLCFEITETAAISNLANARSFMEALRARGCRFALDDFGSGLSSFRYLQNLPVDYLKIDGRFVHDVDCNPVHYAIVRSMNEVGHAMGMATVAEYVENDAVVASLYAIGVDYLQGFSYSRPRPLDPVAAATRSAGAAGD